MNNSFYQELFLRLFTILFMLIFAGIVYALFPQWSIQIIILLAYLYASAAEAIHLPCPGLIPLYIAPSCFIALWSSIYYPPFFGFTILTAMSFDAFSFLIGKSFGSRKLHWLPSPQKTVEGLMGGGLATSFFILSLGKTILHTPLINRFYLIIVFIFHAFVGDMLISYFKREAKIKDCGTLLPGHGGMLDRIDSIIFSMAPLPFLLFEESMIGLIMIMCSTIMYSYVFSAMLVYFSNRRSYV